MILGNGGLLVALIVGLFVGYGALMEWMFGVLDRRLPGADHPSRRWVYAFLAVGGAAVGVAMGRNQLLTREGLRV